MKQKGLFTEFEDFHELVHFIETHKPYAVWRRRSFQSHFDNGFSEFLNCSSLSEALETTQNGDFEIAREFNAVKAKVDVVISKPKRRVVQGVVGCTPCVPNHIMGVPLDMLDVRKIRSTNKQRAKNLKLFVNIGTSCNVKSKYIIAAGVAITKFVEHLEQNGTRVEVWGADATTNGKGQMIDSMMVRVKRGDKPFNFASFAVLANPCFTRAITFAFRERVSKERIVGYGGVASNSQIRMYAPSDMFVINLDEACRLYAHNNDESVSSLIIKHIDILTHDCNDFLQQRGLGTLK